MHDKYIDLSRVPSTALRQAVDDLEQIEAKPETYTVDMGIWHCDMSYRSKPHCHVCMAGASMATRAGLSPNAWLKPNEFPDLEPDEFPDEDAATLYFIDAMRHIIFNTWKQHSFTNVYLTEMCERQRPGAEHPYAAMFEAFHTPPPYEEDQEAFKQAMRHNANVLEQHGY